jgi:hypothetical protein
VAVSRFDTSALRAGIAVCLMLSIPLTLLAAFVDVASTGLNAIFFFGSMSGFVIGSGCAAWIQQRGTPMTHGIVAALVAYVAAQTVFVAIRLFTDRGVNWLGVFFTLSLVMVAGLFGGLLGSFLQARGIVSASRRRPS